jgi:hypothetical protein
MKGTIYGNRLPKVTKEKKGLGIVGLGGGAEFFHADGRTDRHDETNRTCLQTDYERIYVATSQVCLTSAISVTSWRLLHYLAGQIS